MARSRSTTAGTSSRKRTPSRLHPCHAKEGAGFYRGFAAQRHNLVAEPAQSAPVTRHLWRDAILWLRLQAPPRIWRPTRPEKSAAAGRAVSFYRAHRAARPGSRAVGRQAPARCGQLPRPVYMYSGVLRRIQRKAAPWRENSAPRAFHRNAERLVSRRQDHSPLARPPRYGGLPEANALGPQCHSGERGYLAGVQSGGPAIAPPPGLSTGSL